MDRRIFFQENFPNFSEAARKLHILQLYEALNAILKHQEDNERVNIVQAVGEDTDSSIQNEDSIHNEEISIESTPMGIKFKLAKNNLNAVNVSHHLHKRLS